jgi:hypothetical protein
VSESLSNNPGCLGEILSLFGIKVRVADESREPLPYRLRDDFLSAAELSFYHVLRTVVGDDAIICPKVNLADVFFVVKPNENQAYRNKIDRKHVDFLLCDPKSLRPVMGVELDDASHKRAARQERDEFVDGVFNVAELPLVHVPASPSYSISELTELLAPHFGHLLVAPTAQPPDSVKPAETSPVCEKCGVPMVLRTAARGDCQGKQFWGCVNYPKCRKIVQVD